MATSARLDTEIASPFVSSAPVLAEAPTFRAFRRCPSESFFTATEIVADSVTLVVAVLAANWAAVEWLRAQSLGGERSWVGAILFALVFISILVHERAYRPDNSLLRMRETETVLRVTAKAFLFAGVLIFVSKTACSLRVVALAACTVPLLVIAEKQLLYDAIRWLHSRGYGVRRVVIYGAGTTGQRLFSVLARSPKMGLSPVCFVDDSPLATGRVIQERSYRPRHSLEVVSGPISRKLLRELRAEMLLVAIPSLDREKFFHVAAEAVAAGLNISFVPNHFAPSSAIDYIDVDGVLLASVRDEKRRWYGFFKRALDLFAAVFLLLLISPLLFAVALCIRLSTPGPALFVQERVGKGGRRFKMYKFRTMYVEAPIEALSPRTADDPRITRIGRYLRRTSLDELPQLLNVLKGDMSLVGPRPEMPFLVQRYTQIHQQRLTVTPGLTGLWQLSADRAVPIHENLEYDLYYIKNRNFFLDIAVLLHTIVFAMRGI